VTFYWLQTCPVVLKGGVFRFGLKQWVFLGLLEHCLALDFLFTKQGRVCTIANTSCCTYINTSGIVKEHADYTVQQTKWFQEQSLEIQVSTQV
jgi:hypothetical protein